MRKFLTLWAYWTVVIVIVIVVPICVFIGDNYDAGPGYDHAEFSEKLLQLNKMLEFQIEHQAKVDTVYHYMNAYNESLTDSLKQVIAETVIAMDTKYDNLNIKFICSTITWESARTWNPNIRSPKNAIGLMQMLRITGLALAEEEGFDIPESSEKWKIMEEILLKAHLNIRLGCRYLSEMVGSYGMEGGLAAYNGGPYVGYLYSKYGDTHEDIKIETVRYVPAIMKIYETPVVLKSA